MKTNFIRINILELEFLKTEGWVLFLTPPELFIPNFIKIIPLEQKFPERGELTTHGG